MRGEYFVHIIGNTLYSTNSLFWACFYTKKRIPGVEAQRGKLEKVDFSIITHKGKVIYRVPDRSNDDER